MSPFQPLGDQAQWRVIYDVLQQHEVDDVVTYEALGAALDLHPDQDRHRIQVAMRRAAQELEEVDKHAVDAVQNVGYRIVQPTEHLDLAKRQQRRSSRSLQRGQSKVVNVDLTGVEPEIRKAFEVVAVAFSMQREMARRLDVRQRRLEGAVKDIAKQHAHSAEEIADLRARLDRLEQGQADT